MKRKLRRKGLSSPFPSGSVSDLIEYTLRVQSYHKDYNLENLEIPNKRNRDREKEIKKFDEGDKKRGKHVQLVIQLISLERRQKTVDGTEKGCVNRICNAEIRK